MYFYALLRRTIITLIHFCIVVVFSAVALSVPLRAQADTAVVSGAVADATGAYIQGATISLQDTATGREAQTSTNNAGLFSLNGIQPGHYELGISKVGFATVKLQNIVLNIGDHRTVAITLKAGSQQAITIDASGQTLNTTDASVGTVIDRKFVENMPLNGRSFQDLISMTPGIVTQSPQSQGFPQSQGDFSVNGQRTESNYYVVDGVSANVGAGVANGFSQVANTGSISASTALGTTQSLVSIDALQEFKVSSSTYSAEYGRSPGGQFSFSTRSGTNHLHGAVFEYLRNNFFDANDWFNDHNGKPITPLRQNDFGGIIGGPAIFPRLYDGRNKTFFFVSYEGLRLLQPTAATTEYVPSTSVRVGAPAALQPILNAFPLPTGPELQVACTVSASNCPSGSPVGTPVLSGLSPFIEPYSLPSAINAVSIRIDHKLSDKLAIFFRFGNTPTSIQSRAYGLSALSTGSYLSRTYTFGATAQLSSEISDEFRLGYASSASKTTVVIDDFGGAIPTDLRSDFGIPSSYTTAQPYPYLFISGVGSTAVSNDTAFNQLEQWNITDTANIVLKHHVLRLGSDERHITSPLMPPSPTLYAYFYTRQQMLTNVTQSLNITKHFSAEPIFNEFAAFVEDEWRIKPTITLSSGLRWEVNPPPTEANGNSAYTVLGDINNPVTLLLAPRGTPLWHTSWYNFAPRLGVAWTANEIAGWETIARAGAGIFFDTGNQVSTLGYGGLGFSAVSLPTNVPLPVTAAQLSFPSNVTAPYTSTYVVAFPQHLQLPYTLQWNVSLQQAIGRRQTFTTSYVASSGRRLLQEQQHSVLSQNPNFNSVYFIPSGISSNYQSLQLEFQRTVTQGIQALASYTWSHSLDFGSTNASLPLTYGNSDFDLRHNFQAGLSYDIPHYSGNKLLELVANDWALDARIIARTAFPITLNGNTLTDPNGNTYYGNVNYDQSKPEYLYSSQYPGGRMINGGPSVSSTAAAFTLPVGSGAGNAPRNFIRGFGAGQFNLAVRRDIKMHDSIKLQFRAETFNILNHPNFGYVTPTLTSAQFGQATKMLNSSLGTVSSLYQQGGPRSMQFALKLSF